MTQNQLPPDLKKVVAVLVTTRMGYDIKAGSFAVGPHNTASWIGDKRTFYCHLSQIVLVMTEEGE